MPKNKKFDDDDPPDNMPGKSNSRFNADPMDVQKRVRDLIGLRVFEPTTSYWLDTGSAHLNAALGSRSVGLPYGKMWELAGEKHGGKSAISIILAAKAQADGAAVGYIDFENSFDPVWAAKLGLDPGHMQLIDTKFLKEGKSEKAVQQYAESMFDEAEATMQVFHELKAEKQFWVIDSVANIVTKLAVETSSTDRNMRVNVDRAMFLSSVAPKWAGLAANYNAMIIFINQLRLKPGIAFGDPHYTPGGETIPFVASVQARIRRIGNGKVMQNGRLAGIRGKVVNIKNKAGNGSLQNEECGFKINWSKPGPAAIEFMTVEAAEKEAKGEK